MKEWFEVAWSRGLGRVFGFGVVLAFLTGYATFAVFAAVSDVLCAALDTAMLKGGDGK